MSGSTRLALVALLLLLATLLSLCSCTISETPHEPITEDEFSTLAADLEERVASGCTQKYYYVSSYLEYWGFPAFDVSKLKRLERYYSSQYYKDLGYSDPAKILERAALVAGGYIAAITSEEDPVSLEDINNKAKNTDLLVLALIDTVGDKYSQYMNTEEYEKYILNLDGSFAGIGVYVNLDYEAHTVTVLEIIEGSAAEAAGILPGDLLYKIDDKQIDDYDLPVFMDFAKGTVGSSVTVTVLRDGVEISYTMNRVPLEADSVAYAILEDGTAYIVIESFHGNTDEQFIEIMDMLEADKSVKGYVFDLRYNGGGYLESAVNILSYFVPKGTKVVAQAGKSYVYWHESLTDHVVTRPMVVLCNNYTASAAELFTAAIRDYRDMGLLDATIVGTTTYSKGQMQTIFELSDGSAVVLTTGLFNPPCDVNFDGVGVVPDVSVALIPSPDSDNQFDAALEALQDLINNK